MALVFGAAQARAAGLRMRVRREGDCASAAGHTRRPLGLGTAAPQSGCPHPSRARGPLGSQPLPYCGRGVVFHTAVPREACTPLRSSYGDFQVKNLTRVLGGRPRSWLDRPARPDPNVYHSFERDPQKYCFSAKITRVALWSCGSTHSLPSPKPKTDHVKNLTHEHAQLLPCCNKPYTALIKVVDNILK